MKALVRPVSACLWELRAAWAAGHRVALSLDADARRIEGHVERVAATGAFCVVRGLHVPAEAILAVHRPSRLGDSTIRNDEFWHGPRHDPPQREQLWP